MGLNPPYLKIHMKNWKNEGINLLNRDINEKQICF